MTESETEMQAQVQVGAMAAAKSAADDGPERGATEQGAAGQGVVVWAGTPVHGGSGPGGQRRDARPGGDRAGGDRAGGDRAGGAGATLPGMRVNDWTIARRTAFLDHLTLTGQADEAAEIAGVSIAGAYMLRRREARFAGQWESALAAGYDRLQATVITAVLDGAERPAGINLEAAMLLLERRPAPPAMAPAKKEASGRARAEAELLRRLKAYAKRTGTAEPK